MNQKHQLYLGDHASLTPLSAWMGYDGNYWQANHHLILYQVDHLEKKQNWKTTKINTTSIIEATKITNNLP
jgi:hypothetical protein